jgi:hypothetical protein
MSPPLWRRMMLNTQQAADKLRNAGLSYAANDVAELARKGVFPGASKGGGRGPWAIPDEDVDNFIAQRSQSQQPRQTRSYWKQIVSVATFVCVFIGGFIEFNGGFKDTVELVQQYVSPLIMRIRGEEETPGIDQVVIGRGTTDLKFQIIIRNPYDRQFTVKNISLEYDEMIFCPGAGGPTFTVTNDITVLGKENDNLIFTVPVRTTSVDMAGYTMKASGTYYNDGCGHIFSISFPAPVVIDKDAYSSISVVVPREFRMNDPVFKEQNGQPLYIQDVETYQKERPDLKNSEVSHIITVDIDIGQEKPLHYSVKKQGTP